MGQKGSRYSLEEKLFYIGLVKDGVSANSIRREYGVHDSQVAQWIMRYDDGGPEALSSRRHQRLYPEELMLEVVQAYLAGGTSYPHLARQYGIPNHSVIYQWVNRYTSGKPLITTRRATPMKDGRKTNQIERIEIVQWTIANEMNYGAATTHFNVSYGQVYAWVKKFKLGGPDALADRRGKAKEDNGKLTESELKDLEIKRLKARLEHVSTEVAVLKKTPRVQKDRCPSEEKYQTVQALAQKVNPDTNQSYGISFMCDYVGISRAAYYKWTHREVTAYELENDAILNYIIVREEAKNYIYGVRTMTMYINTETPYHVSQGRVRRIMRNHGIYSSIRVVKRDRRAEKKEYILANKLLREDGSHDFTPVQPNITWVTDCSELRYGVKKE